MKLHNVMLAFVILLMITACQSTTPPAFECTDTIGCVTIAPGNSIKIGILQSFEGAASNFGNEQYRAAELVAHLHQQQLLEHPLEFVTVDELCSAEGGGNGALRLVSDPQMVAIVGTTCSSAATEASPIVSEAGLVLVSGTNSAPALTVDRGNVGANWHPGYYRTMYNGQSAVIPVAQFLVEELGLTQIATIDDGDAFSQGLTSVFASYLEQLGGEVVTQLTVDRDDPNIQPALEAIAQAQPQAVFTVLINPANEFFVTQVSQVDGLEEMVFIASSHLLDLDDDKLALYQASNDLYAYAIRTPDNAAYNQFVSDYEALYQELPQANETSVGYDAVTILFNAIESVVVQDADGTLHIGRQALRDALSATANHQGASGVITCNQYGDCAGLGYQILQLADPAAGVAGLKENVVYEYLPQSTP